MPINNPFAPTARPIPVIKTETIYAAELGELKQIVELEGTPWIGTVYNQILGVDDEPRQLDIQLDPTLQQYRKIEDYEFLLDGDLEYSTDNSTGIDTITASVVAYPAYVPEIGDMWLAMMPGGDVGLFVVTESTRSKYRAQSTHNVSLNLFSYPAAVELANLDIKTVETTYFNSNSKTLSIHPRDDRNGRAIDISKIVALYYDEFYDTDTETFLVPTDDNTLIYDPAITKFMSAIVPRNYRNINPRVRQYSVENYDYRKNFSTILDLLMRAVEYPRALLNNRMAVVDSNIFGAFNVHYNIALSKIDKVIYPKGIPVNGSPMEPFDTDDEYYICSQAFYEEDEANYTVLDTYVDKYLTGKEILYSDLVPIVNALPAATPLDRFYAFPVYFLLALTATV